MLIMFLRIVGFLILGAAAGALSPVEAQWAQPERVFSAPFDGAQFPAVAGEGDSAFVAITKVEKDSLGQSVPEEILFSVRTNGAWTIPKNISHTPAPSGEPAIVIGEDEQILVIWREFERSDNVILGTDLLFTSGSSSTPGSPDVLVHLVRDADGIPAIRGLPMSVCSDSTGRLFLTYTASYRDGSYVMLTTRTGDQWSTPRRISTGFYANLSATADGLLYLISLRSDPRSTGPGGPRKPDRQVVLETSTDGGQMWEEPVVIVQRPATERHAGPGLAHMPDGSIHAIWRTSTDGDFFSEAIDHAISYDGGKTWTDPERVWPERGRFVYDAQIFPDPRGRLHLFQFEHDDLGAPSIITHRVWDRGRWSSSTIPFGNGTTYPSWRVPAFHLDQGGRLHAAWTDFENGSAVTYYSSAVLTSLRPDFSVSPQETVSVRPNPARDSTTLSFDLSSAGDVTLDVVTSDGRLASRRALGFRPSGLHTTTVDAADLAPGVYVLTVRTATEQHTGRFTVVR